MILAEKIALLRKRSGWSQEELARQLNVSRQSVSKWESGASLPDLDRILKMSDLFCVSTDYLLRDEVEQISMPEGEGIPEPDGVRSVSLEEANAFMDLTRSKSTRLAAAVSLCVLSPVTLILLGGYAELTDAGMTENLAGGLGVAVLLALVAIAVGIFITTGMRLNQYQYLEEESFTLQYGVKGVVERRKQQDEAGYRASVVAGVILCILGVIPLLLAAGLDAGRFRLCSLRGCAADSGGPCGVPLCALRRHLEQLPEAAPGGGLYTGAEADQSEAVLVPGGVLAAGHGHLLRDQLLHERLEDHLGGVAGGGGALRGGVRRSDSGGKK